MVGFQWAFHTSILQTDTNQHLSHVPFVWASQELNKLVIYSPAKSKQKKICTINNIYCQFKYFLPTEWLSTFCVIKHTFFWKTKISKQCMAFAVNHNVILQINKKSLVFLLNSKRTPIISTKAKNKHTFSYQTLPGLRSLKIMSLLCRSSRAKRISAR